MGVCSLEGGGEGWWVREMADFGESFFHVKCTLE